jgi:predicted transcriptional regulator
MKTKRERLNVIYDVLNEIQKNPGIKMTHLLYKSNLSYKLLQVYMKELIEKSMISEKTAKERKSSHMTIHLTETGEKFLAELRKMKRFVDSFGL